MIIQENISFIVWKLLQIRERSPPIGDSSHILQHILFLKISNGIFKFFILNVLILYCKNIKIVFIDHSNSSRGHTFYTALKLTY